MPDLLTTPARGSLLHGFLRSAEQHPRRIALEVGGERFTYHELLRDATAIATPLRAAAMRRSTPLTAVFAHRSAAAYKGILASLLRGHGYVPLNRQFPIARTRTMLARSQCEELIVDRESLAQLDEVLDGQDCQLTIICADADVPQALAAKHSRHEWLGQGDLRVAPLPPPASSPRDIAYLLFTSGSTGVPKGVMVTHANARAFIDVDSARYKLTPQDRFSQYVDLTFDLSVFDMFACWEAGGCLCCPSAKEVIKPGRFINDAALTVWFSVPTTAVFLKRLGMLKPGSYPTLRWSLFCGEALPIEIASDWCKAAPNSTVENLYGPTELTVACTLHRYDPVASPRDGEQGCVPIGEAFPGMTVLVVDERLEEVPPGAAGELVATGPQLSLGYWKDEDRTRAAFVKLPGRDGLFYRTGDLVRRPASTALPLVYLGRIDNQLKVMGFRVEPGDIEVVLREESGADAAVAVGWPRTDGGGASGIVAFVTSSEVDMNTLRTKVATRLPHYMVPRCITVLAHFPLNANGKTDRKAIARMLEENPA